MSLVVERPHSKYGSAILIRNDLKVKKIYERVQGTVELITIVMPGVVVHSVYKPPNDPFELPALGHRNLPHIVIGDFNSHSTTWGYTNTDNEGEAVEQWADSCDFTLIHDAKLPKSFNSARWKKGYNPDLIFASENMCKKSVMDPIPHTQHRSICVSVQPVVVPQPTPFRRRFNFRKADWNGYSTELDNSIEDVEPILLKRRGERVAARTMLEVDRQIVQDMYKRRNEQLVEAKTSYFTKKVEESKDNPKALFRLTRNMMGNSGETILPLHTCKRNMANDFSAFFYNKILNIRSVLGLPGLYKCGSMTTSFSGTPLTTFMDATEVENGISLSPTPFRRRFNFRKADWNGYSTELDNSIEDVEPIPSNHNRFVENVHVASRRHIPRGYRTDYVQGLTDESKNLYEAYKQQYSSNPFDNRTMESGNLLLDKMTEEKRKYGRKSSHRQT